jgi:hypothetical protein
MASEIAFAPEPSAGDRLSDTSLLLVYALPWRITSVRIAESREPGVRGASFEALPVGRSRRGLEVLLKPLLPSSQEVRQNDEATADRAEGSRSASASSACRTGVGAGTAAGGAPGPRPRPRGGTRGEPLAAGKTRQTVWGHLATCQAALLPPRALPRFDLKIG